MSTESSIIERQRFTAPAITPQALAFHAGKLWLGSRDLRRIYQIDPDSWKVLAEMPAPGIPWAAVSVGNEMRFTIGEGAEDDRYIHRFDPARGFLAEGRIACPDFTGSYLSFDGAYLYLSQWYKGRILQLDSDGKILRTLEVGDEICGHTFVDGRFYVLRGTEQGNEDWKIASFDPKESELAVVELARVPFACRSLAFDGARFWTNHRAAGETVVFESPND